MSYNMFGTREMTSAINELKPVGNFFLNTFFNKGTEEHNTLTVDVDLYKGTRKVAPYCKVVSKGTPLDRTPAKTGAFTIPYIKVTRDLRPAEMLLKAPGESIYSTRTPMQRAQERMARDLTEIEESFQRAEEIQAAQAIIDGKVIIKGEEVDAEIDLQRDAGLAFNDTAAWVAGTDVFARFRAWKRLVFAKSGLTPNIAVFGSAALEALMNNTMVKSYLDSRRGDMGALKMGVDDMYPAATYYGYIFGFHIWEYTELYLDDADDTEKSIMPSDYVVIASPLVKAIRHYGPIMDMNVLAPLKRFAKSVEIQNPSGRDAIAETAPAMINHNPDGTAKIRVLGF